jgi:DNA-binding response OmpR family regulator
VEIYAKEAQADFCLKKPFDIAELQNMILLALKKAELASSAA